MLFIWTICIDSSFPSCDWSCLPNTGWIQNTSWFLVVDWICIVCPAQVKHLRDLETSDWSAEFLWKSYQTKFTLDFRSTNLPDKESSCGATLGRLEDLEDFLIEIHWIARSWQLKHFASFCILPGQKISGYHCMKWHPDGMILAAGTQAIRKSLGRILQWHIGIGGWTFLVKWWSNWW